MALTLRSIHEDIADVLGEDVGDVPVDENLVDLGLDSVRIMTLVERWRKEGAEITFVELAEKPAVDEWAALLGITS